MKNLKPRIYVACLAAYNNEHLQGAWIDANQDKESLYEEITQMLATSPIPNGEEWAIHDYENFGSISLSEYGFLETVSKLAEFVVEHGELEAEVLSHFCGDLDDALQALEECHRGEFDNEEEFAYHWIHEVDGREIPDLFDRSERIRTSGPCLPKAVLYQAELHSVYLNNFLLPQTLTNHATLVDTVILEYVSVLLGRLRHAV